MPFEARGRDKLMLDPDTVWGWVIKATPDLPLAERPSIHSTGGCVGTRASLD